MRTKSDSFVLFCFLVPVSAACLFRYNALSFVYLIYLLLIPLFPEPTSTTMQGKTPPPPRAAAASGRVRRSSPLLSRHGGAGALNANQPFPRRTLVQSWNWYKVQFMKKKKKKKNPSRSDTEMWSSS